MSEPKKYWFKAKNYGWGWVPARWQGWLALFIWVGVFAGFTATYNVVFNFSWLAPVLSVLTGFVWAGILFWLCLKKGEKPSWQWGRRSDRPRRD